MDKARLFRHEGRGIAARLSGLAIHPPEKYNNINAVNEPLHCPHALSPSQGRAVNGRTRPAIALVVAGTACRP